MKKLNSTLLLCFLCTIISSTSVFAANTTLKNLDVTPIGASYYDVVLRGNDGFTVSFSTKTEYINSNHKSNKKLVKGLQILLNEQDVYRLETDGLFGNLTRSAVEDFQFNLGLKVDGSCGSKTWKSLITTGSVAKKIIWKKSKI
jgi:peptidoglycan hydrolase-like protein with peptidoglycan-binding domain